MEEIINFKEINNFVKEKTHEKITNLVNGDLFDESTK